MCLFVSLSPGVRCQVKGKVGPRGSREGSRKQTDVTQREDFGDIFAAETSHHGTRNYEAGLFFS